MKILKDVYAGNLELTKKDVVFIRNNIAISGRIIKEGVQGDVYFVDAEFLEFLSRKNKPLHDKMFVWVNTMIVFGPVD